VDDGTRSFHVSQAVAAEMSGNRSTVTIDTNSVQQPRPYTGRAFACLREQFCNVSCDTCRSASDILQFASPSKLVPMFGGTHSKVLRNTLVQ